MDKEKDNKKSNSGCWKGLLVLLGGVILIFSPLNPFFETFGEDDIMTNSSWLINMILFGGLIYFVVNRFKNKD
ncbi:hypothetical protein [Aestuariivivens sediminis]|uniref:hypothetical protein n=1 Tax=Aestuariivivens sediminis TaxID=2913557 RepID=UPI001F59ACB9|nr:hypothetical protein [Aestuariivivens sediminis]